MKYIGIDYGTKRTGIAISDPLGTVAFPKSVLVTDSLLIKTVANLIKNEEVQEVVIGESLNLYGGLNKVASDAGEFIKRLKESLEFEIRVHYQDERFTTRQARALPNEGRARGNVARRPMANKGQRGSVRADAQAAAIILQTFLDKQYKTV